MFVARIILLVSFGSAALYGFLGVASMVLYYCTMTIPVFYTSIDGGGLHIGDTALIGLLLARLWGKKVLCTSSSKVLAALALWSILVGLCHIIANNVASAQWGGVFFNITVRWGGLWLIPIFVVSENAQGRKLLIRLLVLVSLAMSVVHIYILHTRNPQLMQVLYYQFGANDEGSEIIEVLNASGATLRLVPNGVMLCLAIFSFAFVRFALELRFFRALIWLCVAGVNSLVLFSQQSKSIFIVGVIVVAGALVISISTRRQLLLLASKCLGLLLLAGVSLVLDLATSSGYVETTIERLKTEVNLESGSVSTRLSDTVVALQIAAESPIWGTGKAYFSDDSRLAGQGGVGGGYDAHALVMLAVMCGFPSVVLMCLACFLFVGGLRWSNFLYWNPNTHGLIFGIFAVFIFGVSGGGAIFTMPQAIVPITVFWGLIEGEFYEKKA